MRFLLLTFVLLAAAMPASAETLQQAMVDAYASNPALLAARAQLRGVDEKVPLAKAGARPSADVSTGIGYSSYNLNHTGSEVTPRDVGVTVSQPLYKGGSIDASIDSAEKTVLAERANLRNAEQALFLSVAQIYYDVGRDQGVLDLTRKTEEVLRKELQAARDRFKVGEATKTDVSQAESRYSGAIADRIEAEGQLSVSKATYEKIVGHAPGVLKTDATEMPLPSTLDEALVLAKGNNPQVIAAQYTMQAAEHDVDAAQGALLPEVSLQASASRGWDQTPATAGVADSATIMARLTMPIYRAGADYARTRAAKETASQRRVDVRSAMDEVRENVVRAWRLLLTSRASIDARKKQVSAAEVAYEGVKQESEVGTRTVLDRLNAEAETLQARVELVQAQRDRAVAMYDVKAAIGELTAEKINLTVTPYDPSAHYEEVKDSWLGLGEDFVPPAEKNPETGAAETK